MNKQRNSKKRKTMLAVSAGLALTIVAGSTFAWFSSKDEVTNRLSASANYGVSIAEDFQPPEEWVPGQVINKDVSAVNTGNVDAFVRMWLEGEMSVFNRVAFNDALAVPATNNTGDGYMLASVDGKKELNFNFYTNDGRYYRELSKEKRDNPSNNASSTETTEDNNIPAQFSEVQSVQAGGYLVYAPDNASYEWNLEQATTMSVYNTGSPVVTDLEKGTRVGTYSSSETKRVSAENENYYGAIDASTFTPKSEGLYIFRRNVTLNNGVNTTVTYEYSGYYFVPANASGNLGLSGDDQRDVYLALYNNKEGKSNYVLPADAVTATTTTPDGEVTSVTPATIKFDTAKETVVSNGQLTWTYTAATTNETVTPAHFTVTYDAGTTSGDAATKDDISIDINLANIGTEAQNWTLIGSGSKTTFYYNDDVEAGDTSTKLVDSVKLSDNTTQEAFLAFDFDLNVFLESVQVTMDENGKELTTSVNSWAATEEGTPAGKVNTGAQPSEGNNAATYTDTNEISVVGWTAISGG